MRPMHVNGHSHCEQKKRKDKSDEKRSMWSNSLEHRTIWSNNLEHRLRTNKPGTREKADRNAEGMDQRSEKKLDRLDPLNDLTPPSTGNSEPTKSEVCPMD